MENTTQRFERLEISTSCKATISPKINSDDLVIVINKINKTNFLNMTRKYFNYNHTTIDYTKIISKIKKSIFNKIKKELKRRNDIFYRLFTSETEITNDYKNLKSIFKIEIHEDKNITLRSYFRSNLKILLDIKKKIRLQDDDNTSLFIEYLQIKEKTSSIVNKVNINCKNVN